MISQLAISVMTPIFLCVYIGYRLDDYFGTKLFILIFLVLGTLTGARLAYRLANQMLKRDLEEERKIKEENKSNIKKTDTVKPKRESRIYGKELDSDEQK